MNLDNTTKQMTIEGTSVGYVLFVLLIFILPKTSLLQVNFLDMNWEHNLQDTIKLFHILIRLPQQLSK